MLTIADLKLPPNFSGIGMHYDPVKMKSEDDYNNDFLFRMQVESDFALMYTLGITVVTVLNPPDYIYRLATQYGMIVINRPFRRAFEPFTNDSDPVGTAHRNGHAAIIQVNNEDELPAEWEGREVNWYESRQQLINASTAVYDMGGIVAWQMMDFSKPEENHYGYFEFCVDGVREQGAERIFNRFMLSLHNYGINHPPDYTQDENGFLSFKFWAIKAQEKLGFIPLMISGEWGWGLDEDRDNRFPAVSEELRNQYEQTCYDSFRTGILPDRTSLPNYYLGCCKWIWHARGNTDWVKDAILKEDGSRREDFIASMLARPRFTRRFSDSIVEENNNVVEESNVPEFLFGFKDLHDANPGIVGEATDNQLNITQQLSIQGTSKGILIWMPGAGPMFIPKSLPKV